MGYRCQVTCNTEQGDRWHMIHRVSKRCDRATVWSCKTFQRVRKIWAFECKKTTIYHCFIFLGSFLYFLLVDGPFCLGKLWNRNIGRAKGIAFRKSDDTWHWTNDFFVVVEFILNDKNIAVFALPFAHKQRTKNPFFTESAPQPIQSISCYVPLLCVLCPLLNTMRPGGLKTEDNIFFKCFWCFFFFLFSSSSLQSSFLHNFLNTSFKIF